MVPILYNKIRKILYYEDSTIIAIIYTNLYTVVADNTHHTYYRIQTIHNNLTVVKNLLDLGFKELNTNVY